MSASASSTRQTALHPDGTRPAGHDHGGAAAPIGILYEHPEWFRPLFAELDRRGLPYEPILAHEHRFDPSASAAPYSLVVNRMSPSSYLRGHAPSARA